MQRFEVIKLIPGKRVRVPSEGFRLLEEDEALRVAWDTFWQRRLNEGAIEFFKPEPPAPAKVTKATPDKNTAPTPAAESK